MRHILPEWYTPSKAELGALLTKATIALDANVLLDLYRVSADQRDQILNLLGKENVRPRVWVPYQAALEYQRRRLTVAREHEGHYTAVQKAIDDLPNALRTAIGGLRDDAVKRQLLEQTDTALGPVAETLSTAVAELKSAHVIPADGIYASDPIRDRIDAVLADAKQVGPAPSPETIAERKTKMSGRYNDQVPPGYADRKKDDPSGDLLIWFEVLERAENRPDDSLIWITSDTKEDWYVVERGKTLGPRTELVAEFRTKAGAGTYHQMTLKSFLFHANEHLDAGVADSTIAVVGSLAKGRLLTDSQFATLKREHPNLKGRLRRARSEMDETDPRLDAVTRTLAMITRRREFDPDEFTLGIQAADAYLDERASRFDTTAHHNDAFNQFRRAGEILSRANPQIDWIPGRLAHAIASGPDSDEILVDTLRTLRDSNSKAFKLVVEAVTDARVKQIADAFVEHESADQDDLD